MNERAKWAFVIDSDEFVRLSLNKILQKYGFQVVEVDDFSQLEGREKEIRGGVILGDVEMEALERKPPFLKKWGGRFILMTPSITDEIASRLKKMGVQRIVRKPVDPKMLRRAIRQISFPDGVKALSSGRKREGSRADPKGGERR
jgi:FixJ family two-component response regulator